MPTMCTVAAPVSALLTLPALGQFAQPTQTNRQQLSALLTHTAKKATPEMSPMLHVSACLTRGEILIILNDLLPGSLQSHSCPRLG